MPRIARKHSVSKFYHVIVQGINREYIFKNSQYINKYKEIVIAKRKKGGINILSYCIMNNHTHFLIYSENIEDLSKFMQRINTAYSKFYNKENKRVGYVFRDRYYTQEILDRNQLYNCMRYKNGKREPSPFLSFLCEIYIINYKGFTINYKMI